MKNRRNYYRILHVQPDAPREIIRSSYRTMMQRMRMHPDLGGDDQNAAMINEAYATLADPDNRSVYDESRPCHERTTVHKKNAYRSSVPQHHCSFCRFGYEYDKKTPIDTLCANCQSPLFMTRQSQIDDRDRRSNPRMPNDQPLIFCSHWPQRDPHLARADDISLLGMKFHTSIGVDLGQIIKIDSQILRAVGRVTRRERRGTSWGVGIQFISLSFIKSQGSFVTERI